MEDSHAGRLSFKPGLLSKLENWNFPNSPSIVPYQHTRMASLLIGMFIIDSSWHFSFFHLTFHSYKCFNDHVLLNSKVMKANESEQTRQVKIFST